MASIEATGSQVPDDPAALRAPVTAQAARVAILEEQLRLASGGGRRAARHPAFKWVNTMLGNIKTAIVATCRAVRKKHLVRTLAEFEWRFNNRFDLAAMIPALGRAAVVAKPAPYWWLKMADYGA